VNVYEGHNRQLVNHVVPMREGFIKLLPFILEDFLRACLTKY